MSEHRFAEAVRKTKKEIGTMDQPVERDFALYRCFFCLPADIGVKEKTKKTYDFLVFL